MEQTFRDVYIIQLAVSVSDSCVKFPLSEVTEKVRLKRMATRGRRIRAGLVRGCLRPLLEAVKEGGREGVDVCIVLLRLGRSC